MWRRSMNRLGRRWGRIWYEYILDLSVRWTKGWTKGWMDSCGYFGLYGVCIACYIREISNVWRENLDDNWKCVSV